MSLTRRQLLQAGAASTLVGCGSPDPRPKIDPPPHPNVLIVFPDQLRTMSIGGPNLATPVMETFLAGAASFPNTITTDPLCTPARATLITGMHPEQVGVVSNFDALEREQRSVATLFSEAGYHTGFIGKWHLAHTDFSGWVPPEDRLGFAYWAASNFGHDYLSSHYFTDSSEPIRPEPSDLFEPIYQTELALEYMSAEREEPFLLMLGYGPPHPAGASPIDWTEGIPAEFFAGLDPQALQLRPNVPAWILEPHPGDPWGGRLHLQGYLAAIAALEASLQRLFDGMRERGLWDDTLVVFTSDHGELGGSHGHYAKRQPYEEALRVPLAFSWPRWIRPGRYPLATSLVDLLPTLLTLTGRPVPTDLPGTDLASWVLHGVGPHPSAAFFRGRQGSEDQFTGLRTPDYKYVRYDALPRRKLFDLRADPYELSNLARDPDHSELLGALDAELTTEEQRLQHV